MAPLLLPQPRRATWSGRTVDNSEPAVARDASLAAEGYRLRISEQGITLDAADDAGEFYGQQTLTQLRRVTPDGTVPEGEIQDWPDLAVRAVMLDVSRDKVPELQTLFALVDRLAEWKINQVQLYMEHTFAYAGHEVVWQHASPYTATDIAKLDGHCRSRRIELVPNQNCLGHMERWLKHDRYRALAINPDGFEFFGRHRGPTTLDPSQPDAKTLVEGLLEELLPAFSSNKVHVGLDEPWELPPERFDEYVDWVGWLRRLPVMRDRRMLMWGDVVISHPDRIDDLPEGLTVCEWGYEAGHPFDQRARAYADDGRPFWLCPGTSSWLSLVGRWSNMRENIAGAADAAVAHGARGLLVTDWGDLGHLQYLPVSEPGFACAAAMSWCAEANRELDLAAAVAIHAFDDDTGELGLALRELGDAHRQLEPQTFNSSTLVLHLYRPESRVGIKTTEGLTVEQLEAARGRVEAAVNRVDRTRSRRDDADTVRAEIANAVALVTVLIDDARARLEGDRTLPGIPEPTRANLADRMEAVITEHRRLWLARNRSGGLAESKAWLERLRDAYRTGHAAPL